MTPIVIDRDVYREGINVAPVAKGASVTLFIPPYFIPYSVEGKYSAEKDRFQIEFNYRDREGEKTIFEDSNIAISVGRNTNKLYSIFLKGIKSNNINSVTLEQKILKEIGPALSEQGKKINNLVAQINLRISNNVISSNASSLAQSLEFQKV